MSLNKYYTIMIVPEKTSQVRRVILPAWIVRSTAVGLAFITLMGMVMFYDYWHVMSQITENKSLTMENRRLREQVQIFKNKVTTIESTMDRVKTFATRLRVITNIEDHDNLLQTLNQPLPDAATDIGDGPVKLFEPQAIAGPVLNQGQSGKSSHKGTHLLSAAHAQDQTQGDSRTGSKTGTAPASETAKDDTAQTTNSSSSSLTSALTSLDSEDPEEALLRHDYDQLDHQFTLMNREALYLETELQDLYELLGDQKAFLLALPTRKPARGFFTSGFGVRRDPFGGPVRMHEGVDIANVPGTPIRATADGVVIFASIKAGYGQTVVIDHGYGLQTWYGHTRKILVKRGEHVHRGEEIAQMGSTGRSTGPHVHYEVRVNGYPVNPLSYILQN